MYIYLIETHLLKTIIMKHPVRRERILGSNWGFGSLYILIIAKEICSVCLINPYGNVQYAYQICCIHDKNHKKIIRIVL